MAYPAFLAAVCDFGGRPLLFCGVDSTDSLVTSDTSALRRITFQNVFDYKALDYFSMILDF